MTFWVKPQALLGEAASFTLSKGILPIIALNSLFCLFSEQLIFKRHETTNGRKIQYHCLFKLKQFHLYVFKHLLAEYFNRKQTDIPPPPPLSLSLTHTHVQI